MSWIREPKAPTPGWREFAQYWSLSVKTRDASNNGRIVLGFGSKYDQVRNIVAVWVVQERRAWQWLQPVDTELPALPSGSPTLHAIDEAVNDSFMELSLDGWAEYWLTKLITDDQIRSEDVVRSSLAGLFHRKIICTRNGIGFLAKYLDDADFYLRQYCNEHFIQVYYRDDHPIGNLIQDICDRTIFAHRLCHVAPREDKDLLDAFSAIDTSDLTEQRKQDVKREMIWSRATPTDLAVTAILEAFWDHDPTDPANRPNELLVAIDACARCARDPAYVAEVNAVVRSNTPGIDYAVRTFVRSTT